MSNETWKIKSWDPWLDLNPDDCGDLPDCCGLDAFRRFTGLTNINPNFHPMISVGENSEEGIVLCCQNKRGQRWRERGSVVHATFNQFFGHEN